jgi:uncharacterized membrane protein YphA (DoxX/SURF4 family)
MIAPWLLRIGFGVLLAAYGVSHYQNFAGFQSVATQPLASVGWLAAIAGLLAYVVPALQIVGGVLVATKQLCSVAKICVLAVFGGILGWVGLSIVVSGMNEGTNLAIQNATFFLLLYMLVKKFSCCGCGGKDGSCCK